MQSEGSSYKVTILKNSEKPTGLHPLQSGIGNERVNGIVLLNRTFINGIVLMSSDVLISNDY